MSERREVEEKLRRKEQEIMGLEEKVKAARVYAQALRDVLKIMDGSKGDGTVEVVLRNGSAVAKAKEEIIRQGAPVHISQLLEALGKEQTRENRASLTSSLSAYVRRGEIFTRPEPNTFGLIELGQTEKAEEVPMPPRGFGKDEVPPLESGDREHAEESDEIPF